MHFKYIDFLKLCKPYKFCNKNIMYPKNVAYTVSNLFKRNLKDLCDFLETTTDQNTMFFRSTVLFMHSKKLFFKVNCTVKQKKFKAFIGLTISFFQMLFLEVVRSVD